MTDKIYIKWDEFHQDVKNLCKKIQKTKHNSLDLELFVIFHEFYCYI